MKWGVFIAALLLVLFCSATPAEVIFIGHGAPAEVRVRVGAIAGVTEVTHEVPITAVGDGTPITGSPASVLIEVSARRATARDRNQIRYILSVDSSVPLSNGTDTISFTDISWIAQDGDIPSGRFDGTSAQIILEPTRARFQVRDWHTFAYDNTRVVPSGIYTGSVTYTVSIP